MGIGKVAACLAGVAALAAGPGALAADKAEITPITKIDSMGTGPITLVLIPAFPFDGEVFKPFMERNKSLYTMHAVTLPGTSGTPGPALRPNEPEIPWLDNAVEAIAKMIDDKGLQQPVALGCAMGGHLALRMGMEWPDKVSKVVTVDGLAAYPLGKALSPRERARAVNADLAPQYAKIGDEDWSAQLPTLVGAMTWNREVVPTLVENARRTPRAAAVEYYVELLKSDITPWMFKLRTPTLAIATTPASGTASALPLENIRAMWSEQLAAAESSKIVFFEGGSQFLMDEMPTEFDAAIADFLAGRQPKGAKAPPHGAPTATAPAAAPAPAPSAAPAAAPPPAAGPKPGIVGPGSGTGPKPKPKPQTPPKPAPGDSGGGGTKPR